VSATNCASGPFIAWAAVCQFRWTRANALMSHPTQRRCSTLT